MDSRGRYVSTGHLPIAFHYVEGGHNGNPAARAEISRLLTEIVSDGETRSSIGVDE